MRHRLLGTASLLLLVSLFNVNLAEGGSIAFVSGSDSRGYEGSRLLTLDGRAASLFPTSMELDSLVSAPRASLDGALQIWFTMYDITDVFPGFNLEVGELWDPSAKHAALIPPNYFGTSFASLGRFTYGPRGGSSSESASVAGPYSVTQQLSAEAIDRSESSLDTSRALSAVPEPGSMVLLGTGLFGLAVLARRRFLKASRTRSADEATKDPRWSEQKHP